MTAHDTKQAAVDILTDEPEFGDIGIDPAQLCVVSAPSVAKTSNPRHRFARGNKLGGRHQRHPTPDPLEVLDKILTDALVRVCQREYVVVELPNGRRRRTVRPLAANAANALANLARVKMELVAQREAGEELRRLQVELAELRPIVAGLLESRR